mgnify:CR=1 FL=1
MIKAKFHVFIIPDGNRRFAKSKRLAPHKGHLAGYIALKKIIKNIWDHNVTHFTFWALSLDNVKKRTPKEIEYLFKILEKGVKELGESKEFREKEIRLRFAGSFKNYLPVKTISKFYELENKTKNNIGPIFTLLLAYDGAREIQEALEIIIKKPNKSEYATSELLLENLQTGFLPPVDLMIRTGGEPHLSAGALMWQMQNAHLYFTETLWPDFSTQELAKAIADFKSKERRFGA